VFVVYLNLFWQRSEDGLNINCNSYTYNVVYLSLIMKRKFKQ